MALAINHVISYRKSPQNNTDFGRFGPNQRGGDAPGDVVGFAANGQQNTSEHEKKTKPKKNQSQTALIIYDVTRADAGRSLLSSISTGTLAPAKLIMKPNNWSPFELSTSISALLLALHGRSPGTCSKCYKNIVRDGAGRVRNARSTNCGALRWSQKRF